MAKAADERFSQGITDERHRSSQAYSGDAYNDKPRVDWNAVENLLKGIPKFPTGLQEDHRFDHYRIC